MLFIISIMENLHTLINLHDHINSDRRNLINLLGKIEVLYPNDPANII